MPFTSDFFLALQYNDLKQAFLNQVYDTMI